MDSCSFPTIDNVRPDGRSSFDEQRVDLQTLLCSILDRLTSRLHRPRSRRHAHDRCKCEWVTLAA